MLRLKPKLKGALYTLLAIVLVLVGSWIFMGVRFGIWTHLDYERYIELTHDVPVARAFWHGEIKAGDNAEQLITRWPPSMTMRLDNHWADFSWWPGNPKDGFSFIGIDAVARDGVLVRACCYADDGVLRRTFFNTLSPTADAEYSAARKAYGKALEAKYEKTTSDGATNEPTHSVKNP